MRHTRYIWLLLLIFLTGCREDVLIFPSETEKVEGAVADNGPSGLYVLCEGNMGSNKASLDFMNFRTGEYTTNIYGLRNPHAVKDLGDVGNDVGIYGNRLWAVINCSHKVEVMNKNTCVRIGQVNVPNCRFIRFANGKAYVSSYVAPVSLDPNAERGAVFEIDTATLEVTRKVAVGYQPEELTIQGNLLYVANSGGYRAPDYDSTLSVIDLTSMQEIRRIPLAINLHHVQQDRKGRLWVTSQGAKDNTIAGKVFVLDKEQVIKTFAITAESMHICGDSVYFIAHKNQESRIKNQDIQYGIINTETLEIVSRQFITDGTEREIDKPYGLIVNPFNRDIFVTDAENYVSSGMLYCFSQDGKCKWKQRTGDIPAHLCFVYGDNGLAGDTTEQKPEHQRAYIYKVLEYVPAPGQFVNLMPAYETGDTDAEMVAKCTQALANNARGMVSLGGFGGYLTFCFDHAVQNVAGEYDFQVFGNSFDGTSEPGGVMVSVDANKNGVADDVWYELAGSEYAADSTTHDYQITYTRANDSTVKWIDNKGVSGLILRNPFHAQDYFPLWIEDESYALSGTLLASHTYMNGSSYAQHPCAWGYADNLPNNNAEGNSFKIEWAVDATGAHVDLDAIDFIRVYTAVHESYPQIGELSTEITNAVDLHAEE